MRDTEQNFELNLNKNENSDSKQHRDVWFAYKQGQKAFKAFHCIFLKAGSLKASVFVEIFKSQI